MQLSFHQTITYIQGSPWSNLKKTNNTIVLCPSFDALFAIKNMAFSLPFALGAQDCAPEISGPYTSQVSAQTLAEIGCAYCIIGHSETRSWLCQTDAVIAQKAICLLEQSIIPILCIGESESQINSAGRNAILTKQLAFLIETLPRQQTKKQPFYIAYEPVWAIGTGQTPSSDYIEEVIQTIQKMCAPMKNWYDIKILYGGSINPSNAATIKRIPSINGLLIGNACLDFKKFESIVLS